MFDLNNNTDEGKEISKVLFKNSKLEEIFGVHPE